ncbi:hypothetical protein V2J09_018753 [Rumex salicifolius]
MAGRKSINNTGVVVACLVALIQISSSAATSYTVGDSTGWIVPSSSSFYTSWASKDTFKVGDDLVFNFQSGSHTVAEVSKADYDSCSSSNAIKSESTGPATLQISSAGAHYYICTINGHCSAGQKLSITATAASSTTPSATSPSSSTTPAAESPSTSTTSSPPPSNSSAVVAGAGLFLPFMLVASAFMLTSATSYTVGGDDYGWTTPTSDPAIYSKWAAGKTFNVGDILGMIGHTVTEVTKADYDHCATTNPISTATDGPVSITIKTPGAHYFICTFPGHCGFGQKLAITAVGAATATNSTSPSPTASPLPATAASSNLTPTSTPSATPSTTTTTTPASDVTTASPPPPPKSAGAVSGAGFLLPFLFVAGVFVLSAGYL